MRTVLRPAVLASVLVLAAWSEAPHLGATAGAQVNLAECRLDHYRTAYICRNGLIVYIDGVPGAVEDDGKPAWQPPEGWVRVGILRADPNPYGVCLTSQWVAPGREPQYPPGTFDPVNNYPACTPAAGSLARSPVAIATLALQRVELPTPGPRIAPGRAIVGKDAFLETNGRTRVSHREATPLGELTIDAVGRYYVDWGDGEKTGPHSVEGKPWPDGEIRHQYQNHGAYNVVVTEEWTATWQLAGDGGSLPGGRTTGRIDNFSVQQIQAVILR